MNTNIIYIRTSTDEQNPKIQINDIVNHFNINNYELIEEKQSAYKNKEREKFKEIYNLILKKKVNNLYVWDLDRLYRNRVKLKELFEVCKLHECKIYSYRQSWINDINNIPKPWGDIVTDLLINIFGWIGEEESLKKSDRIKNAVRKKGDKTISYKGNTWGRKGLPKQTRDKIIKLYLEGLSIRKIAEEVKTTDKNKNMRVISKSVVHKTIQEYNQQKSSSEGMSLN